MNNKLCLIHISSVAYTISASWNRNFQQLNYTIVEKFFLHNFPIYIVYGACSMQDNKNASKTHRL